MTRTWMTEEEVHEEIDYLRKQLTKDRTITMVYVSGPCLRSLLACEQMQRVLDKTAKLGTESPISAATEFRNAEQAKEIP